MPGMGPPPKHPSQRRRTNPSVAMTRLPAEGRSEPPPPWPLGGRISVAECAVWADLWRTPQSVAWERLGWTRSVARYCKTLVAAEKKDASAALLAEVRQMEDRLGLSPMSMLRLRWEIASDEVAEARPPVRREAPRLRAVE